MKRSRKILIQFAMEAEAAPLLKLLGFGAFQERVGPHLPGKVARGFIDDREILIVYAGKDHRFGVDNVGPHPAAVTAYAAMVLDNPDIVINAGTAGGFARSGACIGDVYVSSGVLGFHDRRIPIDGYRESGVGGYPCWDAAALAGELGLKLGRVSTGSSLDASSADLVHLAANQIVVKDMEAAAIGWVAWQFKTPMLAVKAITDLVDSPASTAEQFALHFDRAVSNLTMQVNAIIRRI